MRTAARVRRAGVVFGLADRPPPTAASRPRPFQHPQHFAEQPLRLRSSRRTTSLQSARAPGASSITHSAMAAMLCSASWSVICPPSSPATAAISPISRRARRQVCGSRIPIPAERPGPTPVHHRVSSPTGGGGPRAAWWRGPEPRTCPDAPAPRFHKVGAPRAPDPPGPGRPTRRGSRTGRPGLPRERRAASLRRAGAGGPTPAPESCTSTACVAAIVWLAANCQDF
jgi:hypothetical protein